MASIDQRTNAVSLFNLIENIEIMVRPSVTEQEANERALPPLEVVTLWRRGAGERSDTTLTQILRLQLPDGTEAEVSRTEFTIGHYRHRLHVLLPPLNGVQEGQFVFKVFLTTPKTSNEPQLVREYPIPLAKTELPIVITLLPDEQEWLQRSVHGQGGFQALLRRLQRQISGDRLMLTTSDAERLVRYSSKYGSGGFQGRLGRVVRQVQEELEK
jgi:hypothetical protein